jgi:hypothetical protein
VSTINWPWAIILCRFNDVPAIPQPVDYYEDLFTRNGTGGLGDYWRAVNLPITVTGKAHITKTRP